VLTMTESMETHEVAKDQQLLYCAGFNAALLHVIDPMFGVRADSRSIEVTIPTGYTVIETYGRSKKEVRLCHR
jgi:hypothetical protein